MSIETELAAYVKARNQTLDQVRQEVIQLVALDIIKELDDEAKADDPHWAQTARDEAKEKVASDKNLFEELTERMTEEERVAAILTATNRTRQDVEAKMLKQKQEEIKEALEEEAQSFKEKQEAKEEEARNKSTPAPVPALKCRHCENAKKLRFDRCTMGHVVSLR